MGKKKISALLLIQLYFQEELLSVEEISDKDPKRCAQQVLEERFSMRVRELHFPVEREVAAQD